MKHRSFINITLIALMLFSQMIASIHVVGHLHAHDIQVVDGFSMPDSSPVANRLLASATIPVDDDHASAIGGLETDCLIYHAYTNLNGFVAVDPLHNLIHRLSSTIEPAHSSHIPLLTADNRRIRGPPSLS